MAKNGSQEANQMERVKTRAIAVLRRRPLICSANGKTRSSDLRQRPKFTSEQARIVADCELRYRFVRFQQMHLVERMRDPNALSLVKGAVFRNVMTMYRKMTSQEDIALGELSRLIAKTEKDGKKINGMVAPQASKPNEKELKFKLRKDRDGLQAWNQAMPDLDKLYRYERRAWSRRKRAIREFIAMKARLMAAKANWGDPPKEILIQQEDSATANS